MAKNMFLEKPKEWCRGCRYAAGELLMQGAGARITLLRKAASTDFSDFDKGAIQALVHYNSAFEK